MSQAKEPAAIVHVEIPAPDPQRAASFYKAVFGWTIEPAGSGGYLRFEAGEDRLSGGLDPSGTVADGGVMLYLKVADIPAALQEIEKAGGTVVEHKRSIGPWGFIAVFRDPNGNLTGLWSAA